MTSWLTLTRVPLPLLVVGMLMGPVGCFGSHGHDSEDLGDSDASSLPRDGGSSSVTTPVDAGSSGPITRPPVVPIDGGSVDPSDPLIEDAGTPSADAEVCGAIEHPGISVEVTTLSGREPCAFGAVAGFFEGVQVLPDRSGIEFVLNECPPNVDCDGGLRVCHFELRGIDVQAASAVASNQGRSVQGYIDHSFVGLDLVDNRDCSRCGPKAFLYAQTGFPGNAPWTSIDMLFGEGRSICMIDGCDYVFELSVQRQTGAVTVAPGATAQIGSEAWSPYVQVLSTKGTYCDDDVTSASWWAWVAAPFP